MRTIPSRKAVRAGQFRRRQLEVATMIEAFEPRRLLSVINWVNKGTGSGAGDTDSFNALYGATNGPLARTIVQRAIDDWERVITNFNGSGGRNTFNLTLRAAALGSGIRGSTGSISYDGLNKPQSATIEIDDNAAGAGWYFDPTPGTAAVPDDSEFTTYVTQFDADAPGVTGYDFYRTTLHEIGHAMGLASSAPRITSAEVDIQADPFSAGDRLRQITTGGVTYTLTTDGGRHFFEGGGGYTGPSHPNEVMNAGRNVPSGTRRLISDVNARFLRDLYSYTVTMPSQINTFYANLNTATNVLTITGDMNQTGSNADNIALETSGANGVFRVNGTAETIPGAEFTSIVVNAGAASDLIDINGLLASKSVTVNGGAANDSFYVAFADRDIDTDLGSNFTINGNGDNDSIYFYDQNDGAGGDEYVLSSGRLTKNPANINRQINFATVESVVIHGADQSSVYNIANVSSAIAYTINGGSADDTFNVGGTDYDNNMSNGGFVINGGAGADVVNVDDSDDTVDDAYLISGNAFEKAAANRITMPNVERFNLLANNANNSINVPQTSPGFSVSVNGGGGDDTLTTGFNDLDNNILAGLTLVGGAGADSIAFLDGDDGAGSDNYTLTSTTLNKSFLNAPITYSAERVLLQGSPQSDLITIGSLSSATSYTINAGNGDDTIQNGAADLNTNWLGQMTINGGAGTDSIALDDSGDLTATAYEINKTTFRVSAGVTTNPFGYTAVEAFSLLGGNSARTFNVNGVSVPTTLTGGSANDVFDVGNGDYDANISASLDVAGGGGTNRLRINDTADTTGGTYNLAAKTFGKSTTAAVVGFGSPILFLFPTVEEIVLDASGLGSVINLTGQGGTGLAIPPNEPPVKAVAVTINAGGGNDTVNVGAGSLGSLRGDTSVSGGTGVDSVYINDTTDTGDDTYTLNSGGLLTKSDRPYTLAMNADFEAYLLDANGAANTITVNGADGGWAINGNGGADFFDIVGNLTGTFVTVAGGAGLDTVRVNNDLSGVAGVEIVASDSLALLDIKAGGTVRTPAGGAVQIVANDTNITGVLDLADNSYIDKGPKLPAYFETLLRAGYNNGSWNGAQPAIRSSVAATAAKTKDALGFRFYDTTTTLAGTVVQPGDIGIRYTQYGDTDLDQDVDFDDLLKLSQNYGLNGRMWYEGNFNYDLLGAINFDDLLALSQNYNQPLLQASSGLKSRAPGRPLLGSNQDDELIVM